MAFDAQKIGRMLSGFGAGVAGRGPEYIASLAAQDKALSDERKQAMLEDAFSIQQNLQANNPQKAADILRSRIATLFKVGGDTSHSEGLLGMIEEGRLDEALADVTPVVNLGVSQGKLKAPAAPTRKVVGGQLVTIGADGTATATDIQGYKPDPSAENKTSSMKDFTTFKKLEAIAKKSGLKADIDAAEQFGRQSRFLRLDEESLSDLKVSQYEKQQIAKATVARKQGFIDSGVSAADSSINIRRSLDLLKTVKTGGFDGMAMKARQLFGIEGADELELSSNMGMSILAQLKPLFGGAFTAGEGKRLEGLSAKFGSSVEGNKRLLNQIYKITDRAARRGLAAAINLGDDFTAREIRNSLKYQMDGTKPQGIGRDVYTDAELEEMLRKSRENR